MLNALTVDVEDWYQTNGLDIPIERWPDYEDRVVKNTIRVLDLLDEFTTRGTFFVLGCVAEKQPQLIADIVKRGHEIGSHGGWHRLLTRLNLAEFRKDVLYSKRVLEEIVNKPVTMYRAPSWSIGPAQYPMLKILCELGFTLDSSIQPFHTPLSGIKGAPIRPFRPVVGGEELDILEFPSTVFSVGAGTIPFSGGFYLRAMPYAFIRRALRRINRIRPGMVYVHPWEFDPEQPRLQAPPLIRLAQYYRLQAMEPKLRKLLQDFKFAPLSEVTANQSYERIVLGDGS